MARSARLVLVSGVRAALAAGLLGAGCGSSPPVDQNFGTNLGADFVAPIVDASTDGAGGTAGTGAAGATGTGGAGGMDAGVDAGAGQ